MLTDTRPGPKKWSGSQLGYRCVPCIALTAPIQGTPQYPSWDPYHFFDGIYSTWWLTTFFGHTKTESGHMSRSRIGFESGPCLYIRMCVRTWAYVQIPALLMTFVACVKVFRAKARLLRLSSGWLLDFIVSKCMCGRIECFVLNQHIGAIF